MSSGEWSGRLPNSDRVAVACGAIPLVSGIGVFLLWVPTRWEFFVAAGIVTIGAGLVLFAIGVIALGYFVWTSWRAGQIARARMWGLTLACGALLLVNFPACAAIGMAVSVISSLYTVTITNESPRPIEGVRVFGGGCEEDFGTLAPGEVESRWLWIRSDGDLRLGVLENGKEREKVIDEYVSGGMGAYLDVTFEPGGAMRVERKNAM